VLLLVLLQSATAGAVTITEFPIKPAGTAGTHRPLYITTSPLGSLWFTDIGSEPAVRAIDTGGLPLAAITNSEFVADRDLGFAPDGTLYWVINKPFVTGLGQRSPKGVVKINDNNDVKEGYALGFDSTGAATYTAFRKSPFAPTTCTIVGCGGGAHSGEMTDLTLGPEGAFWGPEPSEDEFARLSGLAVDLPEGTNPIRSVLGPDGNFWIAGQGTETTPNRIVRVTPSGQQTSFVLPPERVPTDITVGPDGALWFPEFASNSIGRLTTAGEYSSCPLPSAAAKPHPFGITVGPDGAIWFTEREGEAIGRLAGGNCTPQPPVPSQGGSTKANSDSERPRIGVLKLNPPAFRTAPSHTSGSAKGKAALGTTVSFSLSETAKVTFTAQRKTSGRAVGGRCRRLAKANADAKRCVRFVPLKGSLAIDGKSGANSFAFRGRLGATVLGPGRYRLSGVATDRGGKYSTPAAKDFKILG